MIRFVLSMTLFLCIVWQPVNGFAQQNKKPEKTLLVGGAMMSPSKNIIENTSASMEHTILMSLVRGAGLIVTLADTGPFTVFAPTDLAFSLMPDGALDSLYQPANLGKMITLVSYHIIKGELDSEELVKQVEQAGGKAPFKTMAGKQLWVAYDGKSLWIEDAKGGKARIAIKDAHQKNGVMHVTDKVLIP